MLGTTTVRVSHKGHEVLKALAAREQRSLSETLELLLEAERSRRFFAELDASYEAAARGAKPEDEGFDAALLDGLDADERWTDDGKALRP